MVLLYRPTVLCWLNALPRFMCTVTTRSSFTSSRGCAASPSPRGCGILCCSEQGLHVSITSPSRALPLVPKLQSPFMGNTCLQRLHNCVSVASAAACIFSQCRLEIFLLNDLVASTHTGPGQRLCETLPSSHHCAWESLSRRHVPLLDAAARPS